MAKVVVNSGYLSYDGMLYGRGSVVDVADAGDIIARSAGRIALVGKKEGKAAVQQAKQEFSGQEPDMAGQDGTVLPNADPIAAVQAARKEKK